MKNKIFVLIIIVGMIGGMVFAQESPSSLNNEIQAIQATINNLQNQYKSIDADLTQQNASIISQQSSITSENQQLNSDLQQEISINAQIQTDTSNLSQAMSQYVAATAQTPANVNWEYSDVMEIGGIRYAQWSLTESGVNWTSIIPALQVGGTGCQWSEAQINWTNFDNCENNGVVMGQPYQSWVTGITAFWCGKGNISGTC